MENYMQKEFFQIAHHLTETIQVLELCSSCKILTIDTNFNWGPWYHPKWFKGSPLDPFLLLLDEIFKTLNRNQTQDPYIAIKKILQLTEVAGEGGTNCPPQKFLLSQQFRY